MIGAGLCCSSLEEPTALMKMGLGMLCVGHANFLLAALVHGVVLRNINLNKEASITEVVLSNVVTLATGLVGIVVGILAIILSKNKRSRSLTWSFLAATLAAAVMAAASAVGLLVTVVVNIMQSGRSLLTYCDSVGAVSYSSCPFDPTRINSTTLILWVPLVVTCVIQMVFSSRCFAVCLSFLGLPCCPNRSRHNNYGRAINVVRPLEVVTCYIEPSSSHAEPLVHSAERELQRCTTAPSRQQRQPRTPPQPPPHQPLHQPYRERSHRQRQDMSAGSQQRPPDQRRLLDRATVERSSLWI